jgi:hypothetical protein
MRRGGLRRISRTGQNFYANKKPRQSPGPSEGVLTGSACMKNRHRVSQVVSKLICSTGGQRKLLKQGAADRSGRPPSREPARSKVTSGLLSFKIGDAVVAWGKSNSSTSCLRSCLSFFFKTPSISCIVA